MPTERRLSDAEVSLVLSRAAEESVEQGLTVAQVHEIARDVGLSTQAVQRALDESARGSLTPATFERRLGLPTGVAKEVLLPGALSDDAWDVLVSTLRATFAATGKVSRNGVVREWRNGGLRVAVEPTAGGHRLRMSTTKGAALRAPLFASSATALTAASVALSASARPGLLFVAGGLAAISAALAASPFITLPGWARTRGTQFDTVAREAVALAESPPTVALGDGG